MTSEFLQYIGCTLLLQTRLSFLGSLVIVVEPELGGSMDLYSSVIITAEICTRQALTYAECMTCWFTNGAKSVIHSSCGSLCHSLMIQELVTLFKAKLTVLIYIYMYV